MLQKFLINSSPIFYVFVCIVLFLGSTIVTLIIVIARLKNKEFNTITNELLKRMEGLENDQKDIYKILYLMKGSQKKGGKDE